MFLVTAGVDVLPLMCGQRDGDCVSGGMVVLGSSHLEERVDRNVIHLLEDLESLDEIPTNSLVYQGGQSHLFKLFYIGSVETGDLAKSPTLNILDQFLQFLQFLPRGNER